MKLPALLLMGALAAAGDPPVVPSVDLTRYMGTWHEVAKFPNRFQRGCTCTTATYTLRPDGKVTVLNACGTVDGRGKQARGWAKVADPTTNAKLRVTFFWPFFGDYWILDLDPDYRRVLVGSPNRKYLWILARDPRLPHDAHARAGMRGHAGFGAFPEDLARCLERWAGAGLCPTIGLPKTRRAGHNTHTGRAAPTPQHTKRQESAGLGSLGAEGLSWPQAVRRGRERDGGLGSWTQRGLAGRAGRRPRGRSFINT